MQKLLFSDKEEPLKAVNVASVPQRSPFRYPGGKTWFVPRLREWLISQPKRPRLMVEPFAGGGIISLTAIFENLVETALMVELDEDVAAVWQTIIDGEAEWLASRILNFEMSRESALIGGVLLCTQWNFGGRSWIFEEWRIGQRCSFTLVSHHACQASASY